MHPNRTYFKQQTLGPSWFPTKLAYDRFTISNIVVTSPIMRLNVGECSHVPCQHPCNSLTRLIISLIGEENFKYFGKNNQCFNGIEENTLLITEFTSTTQTHLGFVQHKANFRTAHRQQYNPVS